MKRIFYKRQVKTVMATIVTLSLIVLALPCNCMAMENPTPIEKEHPCHSSSDSESPDTQGSDTQEHNNCCCDNGDCTLLSEVGVVSLKAHTIEPEKNNFDLAYSFARFFDQWLLEGDAIRGSPPTHHLFSYSSKVLLTFLQRWLI